MKTLALLLLTGVNMGAGNFDDPARNVRLANLLADTGVQWVYVPVFWAWSEPEEGEFKWNGLDATIMTLQSRGVNIVIQIRGQPRWSSSATCDVVAGTSPDCAEIRNPVKFRQALRTFAFRLAQRYQSVRHWAIGNEPNLAGYGPRSPCEYMDLMMIPASEGIKAAIPDAEVFGPELLLIDGAEEWTKTLLRAWPEYFVRFTLHAYASDDWEIRTGVGNVWNAMLSVNQPRQIWLTEFSFRDGTCRDDERTIANLICKLYKYQTWERSFYFDLWGNGCYSLLDGNDNPKWFLYPAFRAIAAGVYGCR